MTEKWVRRKSRFGVFNLSHFRESLRFDTRRFSFRPGGRFLRPQRARRMGSSLASGTQRGRESFSANDLPHGKRLTRKRLPTPSARFQQEIPGRVLMMSSGQVPPFSSRGLSPHKFTPVSGVRRQWRVQSVLVKANWPDPVFVPH